jgi:xanthine dehydrogenase accessory factor
MINFYTTMTELLKGSPVVLATVVRVKGSTPREVGAKMLVTAQGQVGTIGGGAGEAKVYQQALEVLATGQKQLVEVDLRGDLDGKTSQGVCGGIMEVWLEQWRGEVAIALIQQILNHLKTGRSITLVTPLEQDRSPYLSLDPKTDPLSPLLTGAMEDRLEFPIPPFLRGVRGDHLESPVPPFFLAQRRVSAGVRGDQLEFIEKIIPPPTLLIVGAGHCGVALAKVAHLMGMRIMVVDDRPDFAHPEKFPPETVVIASSITEILDQLGHIENLYVTLVTRNYQQDVAAGRSLLDSSISLKYLGIIGSTKRIKIVQHHLETLGYDLQKFPQIYAPIGLDIGALTPEEIAISICAEILKVRQGGTGKSRSIFTAVCG